jgi:hypothetical protein
VTERQRTPARVLVGNCPACLRVIVIENNYEAWPLASCSCGWLDGTSAVLYGRVYQRDARPIDVSSGREAVDG